MNLALMPVWLPKTIVLILGGLIAVYLGALLPSYSEDGFLYIGLAIILLWCWYSNNSPLLLALALWYPFAPPVPMFVHFPTIAIVILWFYAVIFFRTCMTGRLNYVPSCNLFIVLCFLWVPVRFLMNPIHKLGSSVSGGHGISGANAYCLYVLAGILVVLLGSILNTRQKLVEATRWSLRFCFIIGTGLLICAFIPATGPYLVGLGMFDAGTIGDGILRLVSLPGYGLFLVLAALCPGLFRLGPIQSTILFLLGLAMVIVGGNRSSMVEALMAIPVILLLRHKYVVVAVYLGLSVIGIAALHFTIGDMKQDQIPGLVRCLGVFDSKIAEATGGTASAEWRYEVWKSGVEKIMESPFVGKGYGNLSLRLDPDEVDPSDTDFETVLASGEAHNGFINAAYGFGIPFMLCLSGILLLRLFRHLKSALKADEQDLELRDFHVFLVAQFVTFGIIIYSACDLSGFYFWYAVGCGIVMDRVTRPVGQKVMQPLVAPTDYFSTNAQLMGQAVPRFN